MSKDEELLAFVAGVSAGHLVARRLGLSGYKYVIVRALTATAIQAAAAFAFRSRDRGES